jgi:hypothetical protein
MIRRMGHDVVDAQLQGRADQRAPRVRAHRIDWKSLASANSD